MKLVTNATVLFLAVCLFGAQQDNVSKPTDQKSDQGSAQQSQKTGKRSGTTASPQSDKDLSSTTQTNATKSGMGQNAGSPPRHPPHGIKGGTQKAQPAPTTQKEETPKK